MEGLFAWVQNTVCFVCILTIFLQLIPENSFKRYIRFFAGLLLVLTVFQPVVSLVTDQTLFDNVFRVEWAKEEAYALESGARAMEGISDEAIWEAYRQEMTRQVEALAGAYGMEPEKVELSYREEDGILVPDEVTIQRSGEKGGEADADGLAQELQEIYHIPRAGVHILG